MGNYDANWRARAAGLCLKGRDPHLDPLSGQGEVDDEVAGEGCLRWSVRLRLEENDATM